MTFVRFVLGGDRENGYGLDGIFVAAASLKEAGELYSWESDRIEELFDWFNAHLPCPPFAQRHREGAWSRDAVAWFKDTAGSTIERVWELASILQEHDSPVRLLKTERPGRIVYEDDYQVVAETPRYGRL